MKTIKISNKEFKISSAAITRFLYNKKFSRKLFKDMDIVSNYYNEIDKTKKELEKQGKNEDEINEAVNHIALEKTDDILDIILYITYSLILTADPNFKSFEEWLSELDDIDLNGEWVNDALELCFNSFRGSRVDSGNEINK